MDIVQRVKNVLIQPRAEWPVIEAEPATTASLYTGFLIPLVVVGTVARLLGLTLIGVSVPFVGRFRMPIMTALTSTAIGFVVTLVAVYFWALIINALAPRFGGQKNMLSALKLAIYSATPALAAGIFSLLPALFFLQIIAAFYGLYLLYIGFPVMMKVTRERAGMYTLATVGCGILMGIVLGAASAALHLGTTTRMSDADARKAGESMVAGMLGAAGGGTKESKDAATGLVAGMIAAGEAAERGAKQNGDASSAGTTDSANVVQSGAAMAGAAAALGAMVSGGKERVEPVDFRALKELLPGTDGSLTRTNASGEKTTAGGLSGSSAEGSYTLPGGGSATVKITDMGNARGVLALGKMAFSVESESDRGFEKTVTLNGLRVHEKWNASGKSAELMAFVGDRFMVEVDSRGADIGTAEKLFSAIDVGKLASTK